MMGGTCVFRVDAQPFMGVGHLARCLALADILRESGMAVHFICRDGENSSHWLAERSGFAVHLLLPSTVPLDPCNPREWLGAPWEDDAEATTALIRRQWNQVDWLVVDHYTIGEAWEHEMRRVTKHILAIDDLADRRHDCDLLLDQSLRDDNPYVGQIPANAVALLGPHYALLRPEFARLRQQCRVRDGGIRRIVVFFGGSDPTGDTQKAVDALIQLPVPIEAEIIVGAMNPAKAAIERACRPHAFLHFLCQVNDMAERLARADLAIGAAGTSSWERLCLGLPALVIQQADNQETNVSQLQKHALAIALGTSSEVDAATIARSVAGLVAEPKRVHDMSRRAWTMVRGDGARLVASAMTHMYTTARPATPDDCDPIFAWRNAQEVRRFSHNPTPLDIVSHRIWFTATLNHPNRHLLICEQAGEAVGVVRFDIADGEALVSIYLTPRHLGRGLGAWVLRSAEQWLRQNRSDITCLGAEVLEDNVPSNKMFVACGYCKTPSRYEKRILHE